MYQLRCRECVTYDSKYPKDTECLNKDKEKLLAFYDFSAEHWGHIRTTNPIESTFATVRHRTYKSKNCFSRTTILTMVFKLCESDEKIRDMKYENYDYVVTASLSHIAISSIC
jgi:putative transposase